MHGQGFDEGAKIYLNDVQQKSANDQQNPETLLIGKEAGKKIARGQTAIIKVRNPDGTESAVLLTPDFCILTPVS